MSIMEIVILGMDPSGLSIGTRRRSRTYVGEDNCIGHTFMDKCIVDELGMEFPHAKQLMDLLAWHIGVVANAWYRFYRYLTLGYKQRKCIGQDSSQEINSCQKFQLEHHTKESRIWFQCSSLVVFFNWNMSKFIEASCYKRIPTTKWPFWVLAFSYCNK